MSTATLREERHILTSADAAKMLRNADAGAKFYLHVRGNAAVAGKPNMVFNNALCGYVQLSRNAAERIAASLLQPSQEERGARVPITEYVNLSPHSNGGKAYSTYWIGG
jgi:hypothetical protein